MKPMIFKNDKAFNFLKNKGIVFSFREGRYEKKVEKVWIRRSRTGEKEFEGYRIGMEYGRPQIEKYIEWSGFDTPWEWTEAIREFHGLNFPRGTIYLVVKNEA